MAENTSIEWCDHTFNPWIGCAKISAGCGNCYACTLMATRYGRVEWGCHGTRLRTSADNWKQPERWNRKAEKLGVRYRVFCASLADVFEEYRGDGSSYDRPVSLDPWRWDLFELIGRTPNLDWLILTKRPAYAAEYLPLIMDGAQGDEMPWSNIWLGTSVENQAAADERIPLLLSIPARVRFLSCEPLLDKVNLVSRSQQRGEHYKTITGTEWLGPDEPMIHWVIAGGESGPGARPMHPAWARSLRDQCTAADVPFLFKQWGEWQPFHQGTAYIDKFSESLILPNGPGATGHPVYRVGKKAAGRLLDGREHNEFPCPRVAGATA